MIYIYIYIVASAHQRPHYIPFETVYARKKSTPKRVEICTPKTSKNRCFRKYSYHNPPFGDKREGDISFFSGKICSDFTLVAATFFFKVLLWGGTQSLSAIGQPVRENRRFRDKCGVFSINVVSGREMRCLVEK